MLDLPRGVRRGRRAHRVDDGRPLRARLRRRRSAPGARAHARRGARGDARATAASGSSCRWARRPPTAWSASRRPSRRPGSTRGPSAADATPLLARGARDQDAAGDRAHAARERDRAAGDGARARRAPRRDEGERGGRALAGLRPRRGDRLARAGRARARLLARLGRARDPDLHGDRRPPVSADEPTLFEIWVCADGYWADHTKLLCLGELRADYRELEAGAAGASTTARSTTAGPGASLAELDRLVRDGHRRARLPRPAVASDLPRRRRARPRAAVPAPGGRRRDRGGHGARDRARLLLGGRRRPARRGQLPDHRDGAREALAVPRRSGVHVDG